MRLRQALGGRIRHCHASGAARETGWRRLYASAAQERGDGEQIQRLLLPLHWWWQQRRGMVALCRLRWCSGGRGCSGEADPASTGLGRVDLAPAGLERADQPPSALGSGARKGAAAGAALGISGAGERMTLGGPYWYGGG
uniref:Uncharacterized protein n=1 Tax=Oryza glumipatula TaxID=40148 RepID=A0A0D9ZJ14_9ORYZ